MIIVKFNKNNEFQFEDEQGNVLYNVPRKLTKRKQMFLTQQGKIASSIKLKYHLLKLRIEYLLSFQDEKKTFSIMNQSLTKIHYTVKIGQHSFLICPHNKKHGMKVSIYMDEKQIALVKFTLYPHKHNYNYATIEFKQGINTLYLCSFVAALYLSYEGINGYTQFIGQGSKQYKPFDDSWTKFS